MDKPYFGNIFLFNNMIKITCPKGKFNKDDEFCTGTCKYKILCAGPDNVKHLKGGLPFKKQPETEIKKVKYAYGRKKIQ